MRWSLGVFPRRQRGCRKSPLPLKESFVAGCHPSSGWKRSQILPLLFVRNTHSSTTKLTAAAPTVPNLNLPLKSKNTLLCILTKTGVFWLIRIRIRFRIRSQAVSAVSNGFIGYYSRDLRLDCCAGLLHLKQMDCRTTNPKGILKWCFTGNIWGES